LRYAAANAVNNDVIDLTSLGCSTISLHTGAITLPQSNITLNGPGMANLVVTGKYNNTIEHDRIFKHTGTGTLAINNMSVEQGYLTSASGTQAGGCIYSAGSVNLNHVGVYSCTAYTASSGRAKGGGVYTHGSLALKYSVVSGNTANGVGGYGGGAYAATGDMLVFYSTISYNYATSAAGFTAGWGGGIFSYRNTTVLYSTISGNTALCRGGGIYAHNFFLSSSLTVSITNSTISDNTSTKCYTGGLATNSGKVYLRNSSIVFNTAYKGRSSGSPPFSYFAAGLATDDIDGPMAVTMQSTLIANNTYGSTEYDVSVPKRSSTTVTFTGNNNLVRATQAAVPPDTIKTSCPLLGPLRDNGGRTFTRALLSNSPGIDQGNNSNGLTNDQRGSPYARVSNGTADIGAYEVQHGDIVFDNNFEGCP
jgi:predicted outer membrane repeat protein